MIDGVTVQVLDLSTGEIIARLSDEQVQMLEKYLDAESNASTNFAISSATIDVLRQQGATELARLLKTALGGALNVWAGYAPIPGAGWGYVRGRLLRLETQAPLIDYKVEAYDEDIALDDLLGWSYGDMHGGFELRFEESDFKEPAAFGIEGDPELTLRILNVDSEEVG